MAGVHLVTILEARQKSDDLCAFTLSDLTGLKLNSNTWYKNIEIEKLAKKCTEIIALIDE